MFKKTDPSTFTKYCTLLIYNGEELVPIGNIALEYQVTYYDDVQVSDFASINKSQTRKYLLNGTQRISIYNPSTSLAVNPSFNAYTNYPVLLELLMSLDSSVADFQLLDYSPKTVNSKIQTSGVLAVSNGGSNTNTISNTVGSSTSQSNSF